MSDLSPIEAAREMGVSRSLVYRLIEQGALAAYQVSNRLRIPHEGVEELRRRNRVRARSTPPIYEPRAKMGRFPEGDGFAADLRAIRSGRAA